MSSSATFSSSELPNVSAPSMTAEEQQAVVELLRKRASDLVERLQLTGFKNQDIQAVDAWIDSTTDDRNGVIASVGAYLGEALVRRHGASWDVGPGGARMSLRTKSMTHFLDPIGKATKRVLNGQEDNLLAYMRLVQSLAEEKALAVPAGSARSSTPSHAASGSLPIKSSEPSGAKLVLWLVLLLGVVPLVLTVLIFWLFM
jgi:hypothetical protein